MNGSQQQRKYSQVMELIDTTEIEETLKDLDSRYIQETSDAQSPFYFSKLALIELCGWTEMAMDSIIGDCANRHLSESKNIDDVNNQIIGRTYGFHYGSDFRPMMIQIVGLIKVEELERSFNERIFELLKSTLGTLKAERDRAAHTYLSSGTRNISAPSTFRTHFQRIYEGLEEVERCFRSMNF